MSLSIRIFCLLLVLLAYSGCAQEVVDEPTGATQQDLTAALFFDGFEEETSAFFASGTCTVTSSAAASGSFGARCDDSASLTTAFSSAGATDLRVSYARRTSGYDSGEVFVAEFSVDDGATWQVIERIPNTTTYATVTFALPASTEDTVVFLRFRSSASGFFERFDLDNVLVVGEVEDPAAQDDNCDGIDDDADGAVDESFSGGSTTCGVGACASTGEITCADGVEQDSCAPGTAAGDDATCDGVDDDCDGATDESFSGGSTTCGVGACASTGQIACVDGVEQDSCAPGTPAADDATCDGVDDDCDGAVDEAFVTGTISCGTGACAATGQASCVDGVEQNSCVPGTPAADDATCDDVDDDCDGAVDEDGACAGVPTVLFEDDFEGTLAQFQVGGNCAISTSAARTGAAGARCNDVTSLTASFSSVGFENLTLEYSRRTNGYDSGEVFLAEVSTDGVTWSVLEQSGNDTTYRDRQRALDATTAGQPSVQLRFRSNASGFFERFDLDDVRVIGETVAGDGDSDGDGDGGGTDPDPIGDPEGLAVRMNPNAGGFFAMPWPSDHRRLADGTLELAGYPGIEQAQFGIGRTLVDAFQPSLQGFGTNSAAFFTTTEPVDSGLLPEPTASTQDTSPVMLVNLDDPAAGRVPVLVDFKVEAAAARPANLLTVLPAPGFTLDPDSTYAVIFFDTLGTADKPVQRAPLLDALASDTAAGTGLDSEAFALLQSHKSAVDDYVVNHTANQPDDVVAFAVYTTQTIGDEMLGAVATLSSLSDDEVLARVDSLTPVSSCLASCDAGVCPSATFDATIQIPRFQTPLTLDADTTCLGLGGDDCIATGGGDIVLAPDGSALIQFWEQNVQLRVQVPCQDAQPATGWPTLFRAVGSGGTAASGASLTESTYNVAGLSLNQVLGSMTAYQTFPRQDPALAATVGQALELLTGETPEASLVDGFLYSFPFNPVVSRNNQVQNAVDALFVRRVLALLDRAASGLGVDPASANLPAGAFATDAGQATLLGHSQGAASALLALVAPNGYRHAYLNSPPGSLIFEEIVHRSDTRPTFETLFNLDAGELDRFHPLGHLLHTAVEAGSPLNYAELAMADNLFITAGFRDGCALRESTSALATRLARLGKIAAGDASFAFALDGLPAPPIEGIETILQEPLLPLPATGNLAGGGTGVFLLLPGYHGGSGTDYEVAAFLHDVGQGLTPTIGAPPYNGFGDFVCGSNRL